MRVSHLATHIEGHLAELDINPLMVLPSGRGVKAVDALVVFRGTQHCTRLSFVSATEAASERSLNTYHAASERDGIRYASPSIAQQSRQGR